MPTSSPSDAPEALATGGHLSGRAIRLALDEAQMASFSPDEAFLLPVVIDETTIDHPALPQKFQQFQWKSLPGGEPTPDFVGRVKQLYRARQLKRTGAA